MHMRGNLPGADGGEPGTDFSPLPPEELVVDAGGGLRRHRDGGLRLRPGPLGRRLLVLRGSARHRQGRLVGEVLSPHAYFYSHD